ncbi:MAG: PAS domain S-box protein, partial [Syntrophaceae bacterium]|nr:PAS domain S-box protein [Syntrophaceae bacterium]
MKLRIVHKMVIAFLVAGILVTLVAGFIIERQLKADHLARIEVEMTAVAQIISLMPQSRILRFTDALAEHSGCRLTLIDAQGKVLAESDQHEGEADSHFDRPEIQEARLKGKGMAIRYSRTLKQEMIYVAVRYGSVGYVRLSRPFQEADGSLARFRETAFLASILIAFCSLFIALVFSLRIASTLKRLAAFSERVRQGNAVGAFRSETRDEIGILAENINGMVAALQEKIRSAQEERRKLESVFAGMTEGVMVLDPEGRIETVNKQMEKLTGLDGEKAKGRTLLEAFRNPALYDALERFSQTGRTVSKEIRLGGDPPLAFEVTISAVPNATGGAEKSKTILVFHDVTRLKQLEQVRTDFVANVTHEIRTPLTAIIGFVETLQKGAL